MNKFDVVIIGAGPAGLRCAGILANNGKTVVVLEKNNEIGPKVCAGGLIHRSVDNFVFDKEIIEHEFNEIAVNSVFGKSKIKKEYPIVTMIDRKIFGQWQVKQLDNKVCIKTDCCVKSINDNCVETVTGEKFYYDTLIGADGSQSIVRKYLGITTKKFLLAIQHIVPRSDYKELEFFFDSKFFNYSYGWIFPHQDYSSIGCCCDPRYVSGQKFVSDFKDWLKMKKIDTKDSVLQSFIINTDYQGYKFGNIYLTGDAAGLASCLTGEGISEALISGEEVAKEILDTEYKSEKINQLVKIKKEHEIISSVLRKSGPLRNLATGINMILMNIKWYSEFILKKV